MLSPDSLVSIFPKGFLIKPLMINTNPDNSSDKATVDANIGDRSKYSINPWGGKGNLFVPWIIKAIPIPNLKIKEASESILEKKLLILLFKFCILYFVIYLVLYFVSHIYYNEL